MRKKAICTLRQPLKQSFTKLIRFCGILLTFFILVGAVFAKTDSSNSLGVMAASDVDVVCPNAVVEPWGTGIVRSQFYDPGSGFIGIMPFNTSWDAVQIAINNAIGGTPAAPVIIDLTNPALPLAGATLGANPSFELHVVNRHIRLVGGNRNFTNVHLRLEGTNTITMDNLRFSAPWRGPFQMDSGHTTINLIGNNYMTNIHEATAAISNTGAGMHVPLNTTITINGPGTLTARGRATNNTTGAGIGGTSAFEHVTPPHAHAGTININSGTVFAFGPRNATLQSAGGATGPEGMRSAGIGGGSNFTGSADDPFPGGNGGNVNIRGGRVYAVGGTSGTGIGGGLAGNNHATGAGYGGNVRIYAGAEVFARGGWIGVGGTRNPITNPVQIGTLWIQPATPTHPRAQMIAIAEYPEDSTARRAVRSNVTGGGVIVPAWLSIPTGMTMAAGQFVATNVNDPTDVLTVPIGSGRNFAFTGLAGAHYHLATNEIPNRTAMQIGPAPVTEAEPVVIHMPGTSAANRVMIFATTHPMIADPNPFTFPSRHVGYGRGAANLPDQDAEVLLPQPAGSNNTGVRRIIITNPAGNLNIINATATLTGPNASAFEIVMSTGTNPGLPIRPGNGITQMGGTTQIVPGPPNAVAQPQGAQVWVRPVEGLAVGTYTANLVVSGTFFGRIPSLETSVTIPISFTVTPFSGLPLTWESMQADGVTASTAGINSSTWATRYAGYGRVTSVGLAPVSAAQVLNLNSDTGVKRFVITNPIGNMNITGATATLINHPSNPALPSGMTNPFEIERVLQPGHGATSFAANGQINVGTPGNVATGPGANVQVWPQLGLPPGTWQATLRIEGSFIGVGQTATLDIPLSFTVEGADLTLVKANPQWGSATAASTHGNPATTTANTAYPTRTKAAMPGDQVTITTGLLAQFLPPVTANNHSSRFNVTVTKTVGATTTDLFATAPINTFPSAGITFNMPTSDTTVTVTVTPVGAALVLNLEAQNLHFGTHPITLNQRMISLQYGFTNGNSGLNPLDVQFEVFNAAFTENWRVTVASAPGVAGCSVFYRQMRVGTTNISLGPADAFNFTGAVNPGNPAHLIHPFGWNNLNHGGIVIDTPPGAIGQNVGTPRTAVVTWTLIVGP